MFAIESVFGSALQGDSIENLLPSIRDYFGELNQRGELNDKYLTCRGTADVRRAIEEFMIWANNKPAEDPKWLWISLHGKRPDRPEHVGTKGVAAAGGLEGDGRGGRHDEFDWHEVFGLSEVPFPPNVMMVLDVCWGGSTSAPARASRRGGGPRMLFGPVRAARRLELNTAAELLTASLRQGTLPTTAQAKQLVKTLNRFFPNDPVSGKEFYRVWWWGPKGASHFPRLKAPLKRVPNR